MTSGNLVKKYIGSTANSFKQRYRSHKYTFNNPSKNNDNNGHGNNNFNTSRSTYKSNNSTELSKLIWKLKNANMAYTIKWRILRKVNNSNNTVKQICQTCNLEKMEIALANKRNLLNKRNELVIKCCHKRNLYFKN